MIMGEADERPEPDMARHGPGLGLAGLGVRVRQSQWIWWWRTRRMRMLGAEEQHPGVEGNHQLPCLRPSVLVTRRLKTGD